VLAAEYEEDAGELLKELEGRLERYGLSLNREKTRVIRFGRKPGSGTFDFLGFTHMAGKDRQGRYLVIRKTACKRLNRSLKAIGVWCKKYRHRPLEWQCRELGRKLVGHYNYYGIRGNFKSLGRFYNRAWMAWWRSLRRRSQKANVQRLKELLTKVFILPKPRITHSEGWLSVNPGDLLGRAGCGNADLSAYNFSMEHEVRILNEPRPTSLDVFISGRHRIAIECKLSETEFGTCSRPRLSKGSPEYCDGSYTVQGGRKTRCALTEIGVRYWGHIPRLFE